MYTALKKYPVDLHGLGEKVIGNSLFFFVALYNNLTSLDHVIVSSWIPLNIFWLVQNKLLWWFLMAISQKYIYHAPIVNNLSIRTTIMHTVTQRGIISILSIWTNPHMYTSTHTHPVHINRSTYTQLVRTISILFSPSAQMHDGIVYNSRCHSLAWNI